MTRNTVRESGIRSLFKFNGFGMAMLGESIFTFSFSLSHSESLTIFVFFIATKEYDCNTIQCDGRNFSFENSFRFLKVLLFKAVRRMGRELRMNHKYMVIKVFTFEVISYVRALKVI